MELQQRIEELITQNADDFEVSRAIRESYKLYIASLLSLFEESLGKNFLVKHTKSIDGFLKIIYKYTIRKYFGDYSPMQNSLPITLIALGSYGREQLCVYSDIDLMIVYKDIKGYNTKAIIESLLSMAWDSGLKLGHRVHEVDDLVAASRTDHTIKSAMIESRFIFGSKFVWMETETKLRQIKKENQKDFIATKLAEYHDRHKKLPISMRADIKNGAGGLRDLNTVYWIAAVLHQVSRVKDIVPAIISEKEYTKMMKSIEFLYRLRSALHLVSKKKQDVLILELIPDVAKLFHLSQRKVAEKTYKALIEVETLSEIFIMQLTQEIFKEKDKTVTMIDDILYLKADKLYANYHDSEDILTALKALLPYLSEIKSYDISFIASIRSARFSAQNSQKQQKIVKSLLYHDNLFALFFALYRAKVLTKLFPPLAKVKFLPQFDGYHRFPVDIHSIQTLGALEHITDQNIKEIYATFTDEQRAILRLSAFLHDCGKGRRKDHSELGSHIIKQYALELGFSNDYATYAYILVRYHTLMSNISAREDIYNEKVIYSFNAKIKEPIILKLLYVLTFADIESVGEGTYSNFNANLLKELYTLSLDAFEHEKMISEAARRTKKEHTLMRYIPFKTLKRSTQKKILSIQSNLLFFKYTPQEVTTLAAWMEIKKEPYEYKITHDNALTIEILTKEELNVGYLLGKLSNLDIATMDIFAVGEGQKYFKVSFLESVEKEELFYIQNIIEDAFDMSKKTRLPKLEIYKKEIDIKCDHSNSYARMKVNCRDQKGLIANIISIFDDMGIDIASAKIQTIKKRARNLFLIEKNGKFCNSQDIIIKKITTQG
jgi:[protein-PII] uridylyltransferase